MKIKEKWTWASCSILRTGNRRTKSNRVATEKLLGKARAGSESAGEMKLAHLPGAGGCAPTQNGEMEGVLMSLCHAVD